MKRFVGIMESSVEPPINCLWLQNGSVKYFHNGKWESLVSADSNTGDTENTEIKEILNYLIDFREEVADKIGDLEEEVDNLDTSKLTLLHLQIGNTASVKSANLEELNKASGYLFAKLDSGYGVGTFNPNSGGFINVIGVYGNNTYYNINKDGSIIINKEYVSSNDARVVNINLSQLDDEFDDDTADKLDKCAIVILNIDVNTSDYGQISRGYIALMRVADSVEGEAFFMGNKFDGSSVLMEYSSSARRASISFNFPTNTLMATLNKAGSVKMAKPISDLNNETTSVKIITEKVNSLLDSLRSAGILSEN